MKKAKCSNNNHTFTNGKHDPICTAVEMADHISKVRLITTCFNDHLEGKFTIYVKRTFEFYLAGYKDTEFLTGSKGMLKELKDLIRYRHKFLLCNDDIFEYKRIQTLISTYNTILGNIKQFSKEEIELILSDIVNAVLKYYDIELIKESDESSDYDSDESIILTDTTEEYSLESDDQSETD